MTLCSPASVAGKHDTWSQNGAPHDLLLYELQIYIPILKKYIVLGQFLEYIRDMVWCFVCLLQWLGNMKKGAHMTYSSMTPYISSLYIHFKKSISYLMYRRQFLEYIRGMVWHFVHPLLWLENRTLCPKKGHNLATLLQSHYSVQDFDPVEGSISMWWYFHKIIEDETLCQACLG